MDKLKKALELRKGIKGTRGIPDGSGPGKGIIGKGKGKCPKRENFKNDESYKEAMEKWQALQKDELKKSIELMKSKYTKRTGGPGKYKYYYGPEKVAARKKQTDFSDVVGMTTGLSREQRQTLDKKFGKNYEIIKQKESFIIVQTPNDDRFRIERNGNWNKTLSSGKRETPENEIKARKRNKERK